MPITRLLRLGILAVVVALAVAAFLSRRGPAHAQSALPTTVGDQVTYLADRYANGLTLSYGDSLSSAATAADRAELANGLASLLTKPLPPDDLLDLGQWVERRGVPAFDRPVDEEIPSVTRGLLDDVKQYLSRPPRSDPRTDAHTIQAILAQAGEVFDALRREMIVQWADVVPDAETEVAGVIASQTDIIDDAAYSRISPHMKRLFTQAEMDELIQSARSIAKEERQGWNDMAARMPEDRRAVYVADPDPRQSSMVMSAARAEYMIMDASYRPPASVLGTTEELQAIEAARAARGAAEGTAR